MKKRILIISSVATIVCTGLIVLILFLNGVITTENKEKSILDFEEYRCMEILPASIEVTFYGPYESPKFMITDAEDLHEVQSIVLASEIVKEKGDTPPGSNEIGLDFIYDNGTIIHMTEYAILVNGEQYVIRNGRELSSILLRLGSEQGVFPQD